MTMKNMFSSSLLIPSLSLSLSLSFSEIICLSNYTTDEVVSFQESLLMKIFLDTPYPSQKLIKELATKMGVTTKKVEMWFHFRREESTQKEFCK